MRIILSLMFSGLLLGSSFGQSDCFELVLSGELTSKLEAGTMISVASQGDHAVSMSIAIESLPLTLPAKHFQDKDLSVNFFSARPRKAIFSVAVDRELLDAPKQINLKLDPPVPAFRPVFGLKYIGFSPNITKRMRYLELPYWDSKLRKLVAIPKPLQMTMRNSKGSELSVSLRDSCLAYRWHGVVDRSLVKQEGTTTRFQVVYDSGGAFESVTSNFIFNYDPSLHGK